MSNGSYNLDENARLLLHAAGELSASDAADLERQLASDDAMRQRLAELRAGMSLSQDAFDAADSRDRLDSRTEARAQFRAVELVHSWQDRRQTARKKTGPARRSISPVWIRVSAVAAAVVVLMVGGRMLRDMSRPQYRAGTQTFDSPGLLDMSDPFHAEQVATLAGDLDSAAAAGGTVAASVTATAQREERSAAIIEAVAVAVPLSEDPVLSFDVPLDAE